MLATLGYGSLDELVADAVPGGIRLDRPLAIEAFGLGREPGERESLARLRAVAAGNRVLRTYLGLGYHGAVMPAVVQRNVLENPGWYTQYTPYQAEISQGRLEALLNFQTMIADLTGLPIANASLLDEGTAAAEAMHVCAALHPKLEAIERPVFFVDALCHPQTIAVVRTRARAIGIEVVVGDPFAADFASGRIFGVLVQYPATDGRVFDYAPLAARVHAAKAALVVAADLLALTLLRPPGEFGADLAVGSTQRFGVPMGYGGPHAAFLAAATSTSGRCPGRIIGVSKDAAGDPAMRMALQTREQHIRREKATTNICTAQVLLAIIAVMYAVYHGPDGLAADRRAHPRAGRRARRAALRRLGHRTGAEPFFDTVRVELAGVDADDGRSRAPLERGINLRKLDGGDARDRARRDGRPRGPRGPAGGSSAAARSTSTRSPTAPTASLPAPARADVGVPDPPGLHTGTTPSTRCCATSSGSRRKDLSLAHVDDPARLVHDEAQRHDRDAAGHLAASFADVHPFAPADQAAGYRRAVRTTSRAGSPRSPASPPSRCSPTPARRASTPACW